MHIIPECIKYCNIQSIPSLYGGTATVLFLRRILPWYCIQKHAISIMPKRSYCPKHHGDAIILFSKEENTDQNLYLSAYTHLYASVFSSDPKVVIKSEGKDTWRATDGPSERWDRTHKLSPLSLWKWSASHQAQIKSLLIPSSIKWSHWSPTWGTY